MNENVSRRVPVTCLERRSVSATPEIDCLLHRDLAKRTGPFINSKLPSSGTTTHSSVITASCGDSGVMWSFEFRLPAGKGLVRDRGKWRTNGSYMNRRRISRMSIVHLRSLQLRLWTTKILSSTTRRRKWSKMLPISPTLHAVLRENCD